MEELKDTFGMLDLLTRPAFAVCNGKVVRVNAAARACLIEEGSQVDALLATGEEEYRDFRDGCLYLLLKLGNNTSGASVTKLNEHDIFVLEQDETQAELQAMALAAQELRTPLANVMTIANRLYPISGKDDPAMQEQAARINRGLYQLLRIVGNMSDAYRYFLETVPQMEMRNICSLCKEIFEASQVLISQAEVTLRYSVPEEAVFCLVDEEKLERAIHNMFSNAIKFAGKGTEIRASLVKKGHLLYLTVSDEGAGIAQDIRSNVYSRHLRQPGIEDGRYGIGLGMVLIRAAATAHGGTVLIENPKDQGTRITMTLAANQNNGTFRAPLYKIDYAGEQDHSLVELSDSLPLSAYQKK